MYSGYTFYQKNITSPCYLQIGCSNKANKLCGMIIVMQDKFMTDANNPSLIRKFIQAQSSNGLQGYHEY